MRREIPTTRRCHSLDTSVSRVLAELRETLRPNSAQRRIHPLLSELAIPLAVTIALITDRAAELPALAACAWCWSPRNGWARLAPVGLGALGAAWATFGAGLLKIEPVLLAGAQWLGATLIVLIVRLFVGRLMERRAS